MIEIDELKELKIKTLQLFNDEIVKICIEKRVNQLEAAVIYAEEHNIEIEVVADLIKKSSGLKLAIQAVGENLFLLKPSGTKLPL